MAQFYKAEAKAFSREVVVEAFRKVGLSPWNPELIKKNCEQNSPACSEHVENESVRSGIIALKDCEEGKLQRCRQMFVDLKSAEVENNPKAKKRKCPSQDCDQGTARPKKKRRTSTPEKEKGMQLFAHKRRMWRRSSSQAKRCITGCEKKANLYKKLENMPKV